MQMVLRVAAGVLATAAASGCLIIDSRGATQGSMSMAWTFAGQDCQAARVEDVQITVTPRTPGGTQVRPARVGCGQQGATLRGIREGEYVLTLEGISPDNVIQYDSVVNVLVVAGSNTDVGTVDLLPELATLTVDWQFERPGADPTRDCQRAGVVDVELELQDSLGATVFDDLIPCLDGPADIINLEPGTYSAAFTALGLYNMISVPLYTAVLNGVEVRRDTPATTGAVTLNINQQQFADLDIRWQLSGGQSCAQAGLGVLTVTVFKVGLAEQEDQFTADCTATNALRQTFVPGDYQVVVTGTGAGASLWRGELVRNVAPGQTLELTVPLAPL